MSRAFSTRGWGDGRSLGSLGNPTIWNVESLSVSTYALATIFILTTYSSSTEVMQILILNNAQYLQSLFLTWKKVQMVKITPCQIPTTQKKIPTPKSPTATLPPGVPPYPLTLFGRPWWVIRKAIATSRGSMLVNLRQYLH